MCNNQKCPSFKKCYRAQAKPNEYRQSWAMFEPTGGKCSSFVKIESTDETRE